MQELCAMKKVKSNMQQSNNNCVLCGEVSQETGRDFNCSQDIDFSDQATEQKYECGEVIFKEESASTSVYVIQKGRVKLYRTDNHGNRHLISLLGAGDIIGFRTLLANEPHSVTAEAIEPTSVCVAPRNKLLELFNISGDVAQDLMKKLATELRVTENMMDSLLHHSVKQRTAQLLLSLVIQQENQSTEPLKVVKLQRTEMAQLIGTTPESLSRTLATFGEIGLIETSRTNITVLDQAGLKAVISDKE